jgi:hypothetical protein
MDPLMKIPDFVGGFFLAASRVHEFRARPDDRSDGN